MTRLRSILALSPAKITVSYVVLGATWILVTDWLVRRVVESGRLLAQVQTLKGWVFVGFSAALIFGLTKLRGEQVADTEARLRESNQQLQVFHRIFRHNIRNDVNVFLGYLDVVRDRLDDEDLEAHLGRAREEAADLVAVSEKLQLIDSVGRSPSSGQSVDLAALLADELDRFEERHPRVTVEREMPETARVVGDASLHHAVREILANAVQHHDSPDVEVEISVSVRTDGPDVEVEIADNGPGIPRKEVEALRAGEETDLVHVSGVGLWLVNWMCQRYGGDVRVTTAPAAGTTVTMQFQAASTSSTLRDLVPDEL